MGVPQLIQSLSILDHFSILSRSLQSYLHPYMLNLWGHWPPVTSSCCQHAQGWRKTETVYLRSRFATWVQFHHVVLSIVTNSCRIFQGSYYPNLWGFNGRFCPQPAFVSLVFCHFWTNNRNTSKERTLPPSFPTFVAFPPMNCHTFPGYATSAVSLACPPCSRLITSSNFGTSDAADLSDIYHKQKATQKEKNTYISCYFSRILLVYHFGDYIYIYIWVIYNNSLTSITLATNGIYPIPRIPSTFTIIPVRSQPGCYNFPRYCLQQRYGCDIQTEAQIGTTYG